MKGGKETYALSYFKRRSRGTYLTALISIALVLFFMGLFASMSIFGSAFASRAQESITMQVLLIDGISQDRLQALENHLHEQPYILGLVYISKEEAGRIWSENTGDDMSILGGTNPFPASFSVQLEPVYIQIDSLQRIRGELGKELIVSEVIYPVEMIMQMNQNVRVFSLIFLLIGLILIAVAFFLIFGTIRLSIYAQRLAIRTMQLIGASRSFIRKPFLLKGLSQGGLAGLLACGLLVATLLLISNQLEVINLEMESLLSSSFIGLLAGIVLFGLILGFSGSYFAVNKYLNRNLDELM